MSFQGELEAICAEVPGSQTATVMSLDGIAVANHSVAEPALDTEALFVELVGPLKQAISAMGAVDAGQLDVLELAARQGVVLVRMLSEEHFVSLLLAPDALVGRGRYALRRHSPSLRRELL